MSIQKLVYEQRARTQQEHADAEAKRRSEEERALLATAETLAEYWRKDFSEELVNALNLKFGICTYKWDDMEIEVAGAIFEYQFPVAAAGNNLTAKIIISPRLNRGGEILQGAWNVGLMRNREASFSEELVYPEHGAAERSARFLEVLAYFEDQLTSEYRASQAAELKAHVPSVESRMISDLWDVVELEMEDTRVAENLKTVLNRLEFDHYKITSIIRLEPRGKILVVGRSHDTRADVESAAA